MTAGHPPGKIGCCASDPDPPPPHDAIARPASTTHAPSALDRPSLCCRPLRLVSASPSDSPPPHGLPRLLVAAVQSLLQGEASGPVAAFGSEPFSSFRSWCLARRSDIEQIAGMRVVQTNEVGRCAALLPCLATVAETARQPL